MANMLSGDIISVGLDYRVDGQQTLLTLHYRVQDDFTASWDLFEGMQALFDALEELGGLSASLVGCYSNAAVDGRTIIQDIYPTRYIHKGYTTINPEGTVEETCSPPQVSHAIVTRAVDGLRHGRGTKKVGAVPVTFTEQGYVTDTGKTAYDQLVAALKATQSGTASGFPIAFTPVIFNRASPADSKDIIDAELLLTTRSQRRRTVGYGS